MPAAVKWHSSGAAIAEIAVAILLYQGYKGADLNSSRKKSVSSGLLSLTLSRLTKIESFPSVTHPVNNF
jgi:hypothetical protein